MAGPVCGPLPVAFLFPLAFTGLRLDSFTSWCFLAFFHLSLSLLPLCTHPLPFSLSRWRLARDGSLDARPLGLACSAPFHSAPRSCRCLASLVRRRLPARLSCPSVSILAFGPSRLVLSSPVRLSADCLTDGALSSLSVGPCES
jgi:hypothetical protein